MPPPPAARDDSGVLALASQCVMCGLCLPHCPTYRLDRHEAESPRGRIAIARGLAAGSLQASPAVIAHLDHCLACLACQSVCPSQVRYEELLVQTRARLGAPRARRWLMRPGLLRPLARLGALTRAERWVPRLAPWLPRSWQRIAREMPAVPVRPTREPEVSTASRGSVTLFPGCVASVYDRDTLAGTRRLLVALGYRVHEPSATVCCGALALHGGDSEGAARVAACTRAALPEDAAHPVLVSASGCLGSLRDHTLKGGGYRVEDAAAFIARDPGLAQLHFRPLSARAALHLPCTQASVGDGGVATRRLLACIGGLAVLELPVQPRCCGAAGSHFIAWPERADRLREEKLAQVRAQAPDLVLTSNIGCRIFLGNALRRDAAPLEILHPLALLARQLETGRP